MIGVIGINHKTAPVNIREAFAFNKKQISEFITRIKQTRYFKGLLVISTCNRMEVYFHLEECCTAGGMNIIRKNIMEYTGYQGETGDIFYHFTNREAVSHLFRVACGMDSMIFGEYQVVHQLKNACRTAEENDALDNVLRRMYEKALEASKKVRSETAACEGSMSVSRAAVEKCSQEFNDLHNRKVLIIGAGKNGGLIIKSLQKQGCRDIYLANRTYEKAEKTAQCFNITPVKFEDFYRRLPEMDIVITSTNAPDCIIKQQHFGESMKEKPRQRLLLFDLSVPRDIEESVRDIENITLYNIDTLNGVIQETLTCKQQDIEKALDIIDNVQEDFSNWLSNKNLSPVIQSIKVNFKEINQVELEQFKKHHSREEQELLSTYGNHITEKIARRLIKNLKEATENGKKSEFIDMASNLFELSDEK